MANVVSLRPQPSNQNRDRIFKEVDGARIELVDVDSLSPVQFLRYFSTRGNCAPESQGSSGAPIITLPS